MENFFSEAIEESLGPSSLAFNTVGDEIFTVNGSDGQGNLVVPADVELTPQELTYKTWRKLQTIPLSVYMQCRLPGIGGDDGTDNDSDMDSKNGDSGNRFVDRSALDASADDGQKRIPCLNETVFPATQINMIGMYTKELTLGLCLIESKTRLRETKRCSYHPLPSPKLCATFPGRMPRCPFSTKEDDGPMSICYKHVISMDVVQLQTNGGSDDAPGSPVSFGTSNKRRLRVFFYNKYARFIQNWLDRLSLSHTDPNGFLISLEHVPAICIMPYAIDPQNWLDRLELLEYCLCIGDDSTLKLTQPSQPDDPLFVRMDSSMNITDPPLKVRLSNVGASQTELIATRDQTENNGPTCSIVSPSPLVSEFNCWRNSFQSSLGKEALQPHTDNVSHPFQTITTSPGHQSAGSDSEEGKSTQGPSVATGVKESRKRPHAVDSILHTNHSESKRASPRTNRSYIKLDFLSHVDRSQMASLEVDLFAVVLGFTPPSLSKRGDWMMSLSLIDDSLPLKQGEKDIVKSITANIFSKEKSNLPGIEKCGEVIRMNIVSLQVFRDEVQLLGKKNSSYAVFRIVKKKPEIIKAPNTFVRFTDECKETCMRLHTWASRRLMDHPTIHPDHKFSLATMGLADTKVSSRPEGRDLTVMVASIFPYPGIKRSAITPWGFCRVWDGTGNSSSDSDRLPIATKDADNAANKFGDPPIKALIKLKSIVSEFRDVDKSSPLKVPQSLCGRVANVVVWEEQHWRLIEKSVVPGEFVCLRNVEEGWWQEGNTRCIMVHSRSRLTPLPSKTYEIRLCLVKHQSRLDRNEKPNKRSGFLPLYSGRSESRLRKFSTGDTMGMFNGLVWIENTIPQIENDLSELCRPDPAKGGYRYHFAVNLKDDSGSIDTIVGDDAGRKLFGISASDAMKSNDGAKYETLLKDDNPWTVAIRNVIWKGQRYFVLHDISKGSI